MVQQEAIIAIRSPVQYFQKHCRILTALKINDHKTHSELRQYIISCVIHVCTELAEQARKASALTRIITPTIDESVLIGHHFYNVLVKLIQSPESREENTELIKKCNQI